MNHKHLVLAINCYNKHKVVPDRNHIDFFVKIVYFHHLVEECWVALINEDSFVTLHSLHCDHQELYMDFLNIILKKVNKFNRKIYFYFKLLTRFCCFKKCTNKYTNNNFIHFLCCWLATTTTGVKLSFIFMRDFLISDLVSCLIFFTICLCLLIQRSSTVFFILYLNLLN